MLERIPDGLSEIREVFGALEDPAFVLNLITFPFPYTMYYGVHQVNRGTCHALAKDHFIKALEGIRKAGLQADVLHYGGIYNKRDMRGKAHAPSTHSWGIAIDIEPQRYPLGSSKRLPDAVVEIFREAGFFYGGDFTRRKDPMHFQLCTGY